MNRQTASQTNQGTKITPLLAGGILQRKCACGQHTIAGGECDECGKKQLQLQRATQNSELGTRSSQAEAGNSAAVPPIVHEVLRSPGQPLDAATRAYFEPRFGHDFSRVRVHTDSKAMESAQAVNALAYTLGENIVFDSGQYTSSTPQGQRLLAHELAHVVQQNGSVGFLSHYKVSNPTDSAERDAEQAALAVIENRPVPHLSPVTASVHRDVGWAQRGRDPYGGRASQTPTPSQTPAPTPTPAAPCDFAILDITGPRVHEDRPMSPTATDPAERAVTASCTHRLYQLSTRQVGTEILHAMWIKRPPPGTFSVTRTAVDDGGDTPGPGRRGPRAPSWSALNPSRSAPRGMCTFSGDRPSWCVPYCSFGTFQMEVWVNWRCTATMLTDIAHFGPINIEVRPRP